jgi:hypothetical protein
LWIKVVSNHRSNTSTQRVHLMFAARNRNNHINGIVMCVENGVEMLYSNITGKINNNSLDAREQTLGTYSGLRGEFRS